jgi:hypothetical protein
VAAVDADRRAGDVAAGVARDQQQRAIEISRRANSPRSSASAARSVNRRATSTAVAASASIARTLSMSARLRPPLSRTPM